MSHISIPRVTTQDCYGHISLPVAIERAHAQTVLSAMHDKLKFKVQIAIVKALLYCKGRMDMDAPKLKGGSNE